MPRVGIENEIYGKTTMNPSTIYLVALEKDYNFFSKKYHQGLVRLQLVEAAWGCHLE